MRVGEKHRRAIHRIELADSSRLLLREEQTTIRCANEAIGVIRALPRDTPRCAGSDDARNRGDGDFSCALPRATALSGEGSGEKREEHGSDRRNMHFHVGSRSRNYRSYSLFRVGPKGARGSTILDDWQDHRQVPNRWPTRARWRWRRLQGGGRDAPSRRRGQDVKPRSRQHRSHVALPGGSDDPRATESPADRDHLRAVPCGWRPADGHGVRARRIARQAVGAIRGDLTRARGLRHRSDSICARARASGRRRPPRRQAGQRHGDRRRRDQNHGLRHRPGPRRRTEDR